MVETIAAFCIGIALAQFAAFLAIVFRYAIPQAPWFFRAALTPPMLASMSSIFGIGVIALTGDETVLGLDAISLLAIYFIAVFFTWWTFVAYAFYHVLRRRRRRARSELRTEAKIDEAAAIAARRHNQYTDEHMRMLEQTKQAAEKAANLSEADAEKIKRILELLEREA